MEPHGELSRFAVREGEGEFVFEGGERGRVAARVGVSRLAWSETRGGASRTSGIPTFDHHRLDASSVARQALQQGDAIARRLPRGYAALGDQLRRALLSAFLGIAEASSRSGADRLARFRCARGEASEAAAALGAVQILRLGSDQEIHIVMALLDRLCAMLTRLAGLNQNRRAPHT